MVQLGRSRKQTKISLVSSSRAYSGSQNDVRRLFDLKQRWYNYIAFIEVQYAFTKVFAGHVVVFTGKSKDVNKSAYLFSPIAGETTSENPDVLAVRYIQVKKYVIPRFPSFLFIIAPMPIPSYF